MTDMASPLAANLSFHTSEAAEKRLRRRYAAEARFKVYGMIAVGIATLMLALLLTTILRNAVTAFTQTAIQLEIDLDPAQLDPRGTGDPAQFDLAAAQDLIHAALYREFPEATSRQERRDLRNLVSPVASVELNRRIQADPSLVGQRVTVWLPAADSINQVQKGNIDRTLPESNRRVNDRQLAWLDALVERGDSKTVFNTTFFTASDSNYPELAGIRGATIGSFYLLLVTLVLAFPIGVATAVYLEEFAKKNRFTDFIEVNINNLAAVPSIVFGLLGLAVFLQFFGLPRSAPLVGGMVLALMSLPTIIIASRAALKAVPPSIREAALGMGASRLQTVMHHVLPLAMPGVLTGTIIAMAQALGETAPLLLIGMNAFVTAPPAGILDSSAALPVQVFIWADKPERGFVELTSAAILVLLIFLILMNSIAIYLRKKFERRW